MNPRSEPLLWLQLVALGAIPLELLGLLLLLAGADPGPLPGLERLLAWAIGVLGPAILLWKRPADVCSLLLVQVPIRGRNEAQRTLSALQSPVSLKLTMVGGAAALLPLFWWMDQHAALAASLSPLAASPRLVALLLTCPLLALILWQWQQLTQALGLLRTSPEVLAGVTPLTASQLESQRLNLGLPLLLLTPLQIPEPAAVQPEPEPEPVPVAEPEPLPEPELDPELENASISSQDPDQAEQPAEEPAEEPAAELEEEWEKELEEKPALIEASLVTRTSLDTEASVADPVAIQPEETAEQPESTELDQEIP